MKNSEVKIGLFGIGRCGISVQAKTASRERCWRFHLVAVTNEATICVETRKNGTRKIADIGLVRSVAV